MTDTCLTLVSDPAQRFCKVSVSISEEGNAGAGVDTGSPSASSAASDTVGLMAKPDLIFGLIVYCRFRALLWSLLPPRFGKTQTLNSIRPLERP